MGTEVAASPLQGLASQDWTVLRDAVEKVSDHLRTRDFEENELGVVSDRLLDLAEHEKWEVRRAVALSLRYLRHESFNSAVGKLLRDDHPYVVSAAEETLAARTESGRLDLLPGGDDEHMKKMLAKLRPASREAAVRVGLSATERVFRELRHEVVSAAMAPLDASLVMLNQYLQPSEPDLGKVREHARAAQLHSEHVARLISEAAEYVTVTAPAYREENALKLVEEALTRVRAAAPLAQKNGLETVIAIEPALRLEVNGVRLVQAFTNILKNSVEASARCHPIPLSIAAKRTKGRIEFVFSDSGCGMDEEAQRAMWRPFGSRKPGGTGLGMPLTKKIIETEHRGTIDVRSGEGDGTTITVVLPWKQEM